MRSRLASRNSLIALISYSLVILLTFGVRTAFIRSLDLAYLGLNGLFGSIVNTLSVAELGFGSAVSFRLYMALGRADWDATGRWVYALRRMNLLLASFTLLVGFCIFPLIGGWLSETTAIREDVLIVFVLYLLGASVTYLFAHYAMLLTAAQLGYLESTSRAAVFVVMSVLQIFSLVTGLGFYWFLVLQVLTPAVQGAVCLMMVRRRFGVRVVASREKLLRVERVAVKRDVAAVAVYRVSGIVINGSLPLLISAFLGVVTLGVYSNYYLISHALSNLFKSAFKALTPTIGNLYANGNTHGQIAVYRGVMFLAYFGFGAVAIGLNVALNPFVEWWVGPQYLLNDFNVVLICLCFFLTGVTSVGNVFRDGFGLFVQGWPRPIFTAVLLLVFSLTLVPFWGLSGLLGAQVLAFLVVPLWFDPWVVYRYAFQRSAAGFFLSVALWATVLLAVGFLSAHLFRFDSGSGILDAVLGASASVGACACCMFGIFWRSGERRFAAARLKMFLASSRSRK